MSPEWELFKSPMGLGMEQRLGNAAQGALKGRGVGWWKATPGSAL